MLNRLRLRLSSMTLFGIATAAVAGLLAVLAVLPLLGALGRLFITTDGLTLEPLKETFEIPNLAQIVFNTIAVVVGSGLLALVIGVALAWANERTDARIGTVTDSLPLVPFLVPPIAGAVGWLLLLSPKSGYLNAIFRSLLDLVGIHLSDGPFNIYSWYGLIFVYTIYLVPYPYMLVSNALRNMDGSLDEQARVCGASPLRTIVTITLPGIKQALSGSWLLMMIIGFSLFSVPLIIATGAKIKIASVEVVNFLTLGYPPKTGPAVGLSAILVVLVGASWLWQVRVLKKNRYAALGGKGLNRQRAELGKFKWIWRSALLLYGLVATLLPVVALVIVSFTGFWTTTIRWSSLNVRSFSNAFFGDSLTFRSIENTLWIGIVGSSIGIVAVALAAVFVRGKRAQRTRAFVDSMVKLPSVFPGLILAVGFVLVFSGPPLNLGGTATILILAYICLYMSQASVASDAALSQIGSELPEAAAIAGARRGRIFVDIYLPLMMSGLMAGWAFLFVRVISDLTATALLSGPSNIVVGYRIMQIFSSGSFGDLGAITIMLTVLSAVVVLSLLAAGRRLASWERAGR